MLTNLTIYYGSSSTQIVPLNGLDYTNAILNIVRNGGFWFTDPTGLLTYIPFSQITKITAA